MLTRKVGERIVIGNAGDRLMVTVIEIKGKFVRLGVDAPAHVRVDREEVTMRREAEAAASPTTEG